MLKPDMNQAQHFLTLLAGDEPVTFQTFGEGATKNPNLARILHGNLEEHAAVLSALNAQGAGVFVMVNRGDGLGRKAANVTGIRALFVDLDGAPLEPVLAAGVEPHLTIESSADRYHAYWLVFDCALDQFTRLQAALATKFNSDHKVKDLPRVMRLPGFWHQKAEPFQTHIIEEKSHAPFAVADLMARLELNAQPTAQSAGNTTPQALTFDPKNAIAGFAQGNRDDGLFRYACRLRGLGVEKEEARLLVLAAAAKCQPPMPEPDATKCLESAWCYDSAPAWLMPQPLTAKIEAEPYPIDALPDTIRAAVGEVGGFVKAPVPLVASSAIAALSLAIQAHYDVERASKLHSPVSTFTLVIAESGERKSTCDGFFTKAIRDYESAQVEAAKPFVKDYNASIESWEAKRSGIKEKIRQLAKEKKPTAGLEADMRELGHDKPEPPQIPRLIYGDITPEELAYSMAKKWPSGGVVSAEAGVVFGSHGMGKDSLWRHWPKWGRSRQAHRPSPKCRKEQLTNGRFRATQQTSR